MYNEQQKLSFINFYTSDSKMQSHCRILFKKLEPVEAELDKDISCFDLSDIDKAMSAVSGFSSTTTRKYVYTLKRYIKWCINNELPNVNEALLLLNPSDIQADSTEGIRQRLISSPRHLQSLLDATFRPIEMNSTQNLYRLFFWFAYSGLTEIDMKHVTADDIDWDNMAIYAGGESFPIYREEVPIIKNCIKLTDFERRSPLHSNITFLPRAEGKAIMRGTDGSKYDVNKSEISVAVREAYKQNKINFVLSYRNVWTSGVFYNAYECERAGIPHDFSLAVKQYFINKGVDPYAIEHCKRVEMNKKFLLDYNRWKEVSLK